VRKWRLRLDSLNSLCLSFHFLSLLVLFHSFLQHILDSLAILAVGIIHQKAQAVKFNCSCTSVFTECSCILLISSLIDCNSGDLRLQFSSTNFQVQLIAVLPDYSGYNYFLHFFIKFNVFYSDFYLFINI
jgi:hypothetical protein